MRKLIAAFLFLFASVVFFTSCEKEEHVYQPPNANFDIDIMHMSCIYEGESLRVYNPRDNDTYFFHPKYFEVKWYMNNKLLHDGVQLDCVCGNTYEVVVRHLRDGKTKKLGVTAIKCREEGS